LITSDVASESVLAIFIQKSQRWLKRMFYVVGQAVNNDNMPAVTNTS